MLDIIIERGNQVNKDYMFVFYCAELRQRGGKTLTNNKSILILVDEDVPHFDRSMADPYPKLAKVFKFSGYSVFHYYEFDKAID